MTTNFDTSKRITCDIKELRKLLGVGRLTCERIAENSNAIIKVGNRKLYNIAKIQRYLEKVSK